MCVFEDDGLCCIVIASVCMYNELDLCRNMYKSKQYYFCNIQTFENSLSELEPMESLRHKIQEKNTAMREIAKQLGDVRDKQMDIGNEREQYQDVIRYVTDIR